MDEENLNIINEVVNDSDDINIDIANASSALPSLSSSSSSPSNTSEINEVKLENCEINENDDDVNNIKSENKENLMENIVDTSTTTKTAGVATIVTTSLTASGSAEGIDSNTNCHKKLTYKLRQISDDKESMDEFRDELRSMREKRLSAVAELKNEILNLRKQLAEQKEINLTLTTANNSVAEENSINPNDSNDDITDGISNTNEPFSDPTKIALRSELSDTQLSLQLANSEIIALTSELKATQKQVASLKEVIVFSKQMVDIRENQVNQLKLKLKEIEDSMAEREVKIMSENLRKEYDRQLANIRNLRALYDERARVSAAERENLIRQLETKRAELNTEMEKTANLEGRIAELEKDIEITTEQLNNTKDQLSAYKGDNKDLLEEMAVINQFFSQFLMGFNGGSDINIDKLTHMLEDHRDLLNDITNRETCKDGAAALPKLLFDLVTQLENNDTDSIILEKNEETAPVASSSSTAAELDQSNSAILLTNYEKEKSPSKTTAQEIVHNLPKVWKVLIELLNHQKAEKVPFIENGESEDCYNSVQTPTGTKQVLSVSKTYIKLKDLILEKKFLQKETNKLKNLNTHLEGRLGQQEKRLSAVTVELNKTWSLVGRMQRQHRQLHTHEQVLRYQLQQKRRMLTELKDELEYCRRKWALAREKNNESQSQWNILRKEFSNRKLLDANNSAESGYSDDPLSDEDTASDFDGQQLLLKDAAGILVKETVASGQKINVCLIRSESSICLQNQSNDDFNFKMRRGKSAPPVTPWDDKLKFLNLVGNKLLDDTHDFQVNSASMELDPNLGELQVVDTTNQSITCGVLPVSMGEIEEEGENGITNQICVATISAVMYKSADTVLNQSALPKPTEIHKKPSSKSGNRKGIKSGKSKNIMGAKKLPDLSRETRLKTQAKEKEEILKGETLEEMFYRLSGTAAPETSEEQPNTAEDESENDESDYETDSDNDDDDGISSNRIIPEAVAVRTPESITAATDALILQDEERRNQRAARFKCLEDQCTQLINKICQTSHRGSALNEQIDQVHRRYTPIRETPNTSTPTVALDEQIASSTITSSVINLQATTDDEQSSSTSCLSQREHEFVSRRAERLKRLEEECNAFLNRVNCTNNKADEINAKLGNLHTRYGGSSSGSGGAGTSDPSRDSKLGMNQPSTTDNSNIDTNDGIKNTDELMVEKNVAVTETVQLIPICHLVEENLSPSQLTMEVHVNSSDDNNLIIFNEESASTTEEPITNSDITSNEESSSNCNNKDEENNADNK